MRDVNQAELGYEMRAVRSPGWTPGTTLDHRIRVLGYEVDTRVTVDLITREALFQISLWLSSKKADCKSAFLFNL